LKLLQTNFSNVEKTSASEFSRAKSLFQSLDRYMKGRVHKSRIGWTLLIFSIIAIATPARSAIAEQHQSTAQSILPTAKLISTLPKVKSTPISPPDFQTQTLPQQETPSDVEPSINAWDRITLVRTLEGYSAPVESLVFSRDGKFVIGGGGENDPQLRFWSFKDGKQLQQFRAGRTAILTMAISPDNSTLVSGGEDAGLNLWNWHTGRYRRVFLEHSNSITSTAIANDSQTLISGSLDGIRVWDLGSGRPLYTLAGLGNATSALAVSADDRLLASGTPDGRIKFWNLRTGTYISEFFAHQQAIVGTVFTNDGKLITASSDRAIKIWDLKSRKLLKTLNAHQGSIRAIALNPDNQTLASAGNDGIFLWNISTGELLTKIGDRLDWMQSLAFSPDGHFLASGSYDGTVKIWQDAFAGNRE
jgi:WD40 repeat protein